MPGPASMFTIGAVSAVAAVATAGAAASVIVGVVEAPHAVDWTTVLLALIAAAVSLGGPVVAFLLAKSVAQAKETKELVQETLAVGRETHTASNTNYQKMADELKTLKDALAAKNIVIENKDAAILDLSIGKATSDAKVAPIPVAPAATAAPATDHASIMLTTKPTGAPVFADKPPETKP